MRRIVILSMVTLLGIATTSCGGRVSTAEYAEEVETLVRDMIDRLDELDLRYESADEVAEVRQYAHLRVAARERMLTGLEDLEPPGNLEALHTEAVGIMSLLTEAEMAMADRVDESDEFISVPTLWNTPEGVAASEATMRAFLLCEAAQADFDRTRAAEEFKDVPWIPSEMKEVIDVAFGCQFTDRQR
ncbi:MAG TPA: hypothetical protein VLA29_00310 [Acidimicrobiia bacterium]|nr:hypothetical protein [Acidimicrobiia bacterium]